MESITQDTATPRVTPHVHFTCTSYAFCAYLYCIYALVGGAISIRDRYICAVHESVLTNCTVASTSLLSVYIVKTAICFKTKVEAYFVGGGK